MRSLVLLTQGLKAVRFERLDFSRSKDHNISWPAQMFLKFMLGYVHPALHCLFRMKRYQFIVNKE